MRYLYNESILYAFMYNAIYKISYDNLTIMPTLRSTYDARTIYQTLTKNAGLIVTYDSHAKSSDSLRRGVRELAYNIPERNFSTLYVTIISRSYDKLQIMLRQIVRYFVNRAHGFH